MSNPRYDWWGYAKAMLRRYPDKCNPNEKRAVEAAIQETKQLETGEERMKIIEMVFFKRTHSLEGAAMAAFVSLRTAQRWHADFIRDVGRNFSCGSLIVDSDADSANIELPALREPQVIKSDLLQKLSAVQRKIIVLMTEFDMGQTKVGITLGMTQGGVNGHLRTIKRRTGIDPFTFWGLTALYEAIKKEDTDVH